jgi:iron complex transport system substrate-binding protein
MRNWAAALLFLTGAAVPAFELAAYAAGADAPSRIVSANLCADRLVLALADRDKIVSVSHFATDQTLSTVAEQAEGLTPNHADAEEIASMHPDLVIFGQYTQRANSDMLKSLGYSVYMLPHPRDLAAMRKTIMDLAARLGVPERGQAMVAEIDAKLAALPVHQPAKAAFYTAGGWTSGKPSLADDLLKRMGASNIATEAGLGSSGTLPLETLVAAGPQLIIFETLGTRGKEQVSLASQLLDHPALAERGVRRLDMPMKLWDCADASIVDAALLIDKALP